MADFSALKATINANVKTNGNQDITGAVMNSVLKDIVDDVNDKKQDPITVTTGPGTTSFNIDGVSHSVATDPVSVPNIYGTGADLADIRIGGVTKTIKAEALDAAPTAGSTKGVTSDGIRTAIDEGGVLRLAISVGEVITGKYISSNGVVTNYYAGGLIKYDLLSELSKVHLTGTAIGALTSSIAFFDGTDLATATCLSHYTYTGAVDQFIDVPEEAKMMTISKWSSGESLSIDQYQVKDLSPRIDTLDAQVNGTFVASDKPWVSTSGGYISSSSGIVRNSQTQNLLMEFALSANDYDKIRMTVGKNVGGDIYKYCAFVDANSNIIEYGSYDDWSTPGIETHTLSIPSNTASVAIYTTTAILATPTITLLKQTQTGVVDEIDSVKGYLSNSLESINKPFDFSGKTIAAFGDSITAGFVSPLDAHYPYSDGYMYKFASAVGATLDNEAVGGTTIVPNIVQYGSIYDAITAYTGNADFIWIAGGINDANFGSPLGQYGDTSSDTFYGTLYNICEFLQSNHPTKKVIWVSPIPKTVQNKSVWTILHPLEDYRRAIYEMATKYGHSVVNGALLGMPARQGGWNNDMIDDADGVHPTQAGHLLYSRSLTGKLL